jgi:TRAP-type C4-dicarboxylate transport system substrate-binding protein
VKKKILFIFLALTLLAFPFLTACEAEEEITPPAGGGEEEEGPGEEVTYPIELKIANYFAPTAKHSLILEEFGNELEARTDGLVQVDYYAGGSLLDAPSMFDGVVDGIADIGYSHVYYTPGRMPVTEFAGLPLAYPSAWVSGEVLNDFYNEFKPAEWDDVVVLFMNTSTPSAISNATRPIHTLEDLEGLVIRAPGLSGDVIAALGGTPAPTPMMEVYDAISKGEIDGEQSNFETLLSFGFAEVVKYVTSIWQISFPYPFYCVMNKDSYNNLPTDIKLIFDELVGEYKERFLLVWNAIDFMGKEYAESLGVQFFDLTDAEAARWQAAVAPVIEDYVAKMVAAGYSETEVRGWIDFLRERADYWTTKQIEYRIPSVAGPPEVRID